MENIIFESVKNAGIITFNRPKELNAIDDVMFKQLYEHLREWEKTKKLVIIKGSGRAFCVGGDLKKDSRKVYLQRHYSIGYNVLYTMSKYKIPTVVFMNGLTFGAGLGVAMQGRYRIASKSTQAAMPEVRIGFFPDMGASYFLTRLPDNIGVYLGMTGERVKGKDAVKVGFATHFVTNSRFKDLEEALTECSNDDEVKTILNKFKETTGKLSSHLINDIKYSFTLKSVEDVICNLEMINNDWAVKTADKLKNSCPSSLKITLRSLRLGMKLDLAHCIRMEYRVINRMLQGHDFREGIRAYLVFKHNKPKWQHRSLAQVTDEFVEKYFEMLPTNEELKFLELQSRL